MLRLVLIRAISALAALLLLFHADIQNLAESHAEKTAGMNRMLNSTEANLTFITLAGSGASGTKDGLGLTANFGKMRDVAVDAVGNVYVADTSNNTIRRVTPRGGVSTIAGLAGQSGISDGIGTIARFSGPQGIAVDEQGAVYVADITGKIIRKLTRTTASGEKDWKVETIAGMGNVSGSQDGTGRQARFLGPRGIAIDGAGNLYVTELSNHTVRKISPQGVGWIVSTVAGLASSAGSRDGANNLARFNQPTGIAVDSNTNLYIADLGNNSIRRVVPNGANWIVSTIAGTTVSGYADGPSANARFTQPNGIALAPDGAFYIPEYGNGTVRRLKQTGDTWIVSTAAGLGGVTGFQDGTGSGARFFHPVGVACDQLGNVYIGDIDNFAVRKGWVAGTRAAGRFEQARVTSTEAILDFTIMTGSMTNLNLMRSEQIMGTWTADANVMISTNIRNVSYRITAPMTVSASAFFKSQIE